MPLNIEIEINLKLTLCRLKGSLNYEIHGMERSEDIFELNFKDGMIGVQRHLVSNQTITG